MDQLVQSTPSIIEQAAKSPLGIFALMVIALAVMGFFFFRTSSERTRMAMFVLMFLGVAAFGMAAVRSSLLPAGPDSPKEADSPPKTASQETVPPSSMAPPPKPASQKTVPPSSADPLPKQTSQETVPLSSADSPPKQAPQETGHPSKVIEISGAWKAKVPYSWGGTYKERVIEERFMFKATQGELWGTASYLKLPRGISEGTIKGEAISFTVSLEEILGDETRKYSNFYRGVISGNEIRFVMQDSRGNPPIEFTATR